MKNIIFGIIGVITFYSCSLQQPQIIQPPKWHHVESCPAEHICGNGLGKSFEISLFNALGNFSQILHHIHLIENSDTFNQSLLNKSDLMIGADLYFTSKMEWNSHDDLFFQEQKTSFKNDTMDALIILSTSESDLNEFKQDVTSNYSNCSIDDIVDYLKINGYNIKTEELNGYFFCTTIRLREEIK